MTPEQRSDQDLSMTIRSDPEAVRAALIDIHRNLAARGFAPMFCLEVELVLAEVLNNIVEHANRDQPGAPITVQLAGATAAGPDRLACTVIDTGHPMPDLVLPAPRAHVLDAADPDTLPEGGFGWGLIHGLTTSLGYRRIGGRNRLSFTIAAQTGSIG